eukprot:gene8423-10342_t
MNINPDLQNERNGASFSVKDLTSILNQNDPFGTEIKLKIRKEFENDPNIGQPQNYHFLSREEQFTRALAVSSKMIQVKKKLGLLEMSPNIFYYHLNAEIPFLLHDVVFLGCIKSLASDEQLKEWLPLALNYKLIGCYSQTELGHGSNVQGLETTIHYIKETDEFEINSPTLTSTKWWVGGLGKLCTHTVVFGQLWLKDEHGQLTNYGPHAVLVPIRSLEDHTPLKGVTVGDIGPKLGFAGVDNGYLRLDHVRVPRSNMLQRFARVSPEGLYIKPPHSRLIYAGMVGVRVHIVEDSFTHLSRAITIATRYSVVRRQFKGPNDPKTESKVLDYSNQMNRIFPHIATCYAYFFAGKHLSSCHERMKADIKARKDISLLPELHANSAGLKTVVTYGTSEGIEACRLACGGHGYSKFSGLPTLQNNYVHVVTAEGENNILPQQTARYLLKMLKSASEGKPITGDSVRYIQDEFSSEFNSINQFMSANKLSTLFDLRVLLQLFKRRSFMQIRSMAMAIQDGLSSNSENVASVWSELNVEALRVNKAHCQYFVLNSFITSINSIPADGPIRNVLTRLCKLYALYNLERDLSEFLQESYLSINEIEPIRREIRTLFKEIRPDAVSLVDAFDIPDFTLGSALGRYDGRVYETLWEWAHNQPFNKNSVVNGYDQYLKPLIKSKL